MPDGRLRAPSLIQRFAERASGARRSTGRVRATGAQEQRPTLEMEQRRRSAECDDLNDGRSHRQNTVGTAALRRTTRAERTKGSMSIGNVGGRFRADLLARAERAAVSRIEAAGSREGGQQRQDRSER